MAEAGFWKSTGFSCTAGDDFDSANSNVNGYPKLITHPSTPGKCFLRLAEERKGTAAASAFVSYTLNSAKTFSTSFEYRLFGVTGSPADGITFTMHQDSRGATALGGTGGYLGVYNTNPIKNALVIELDTCKLH